MPNNIGGHGLTDREMMQLCLELEKARIHSSSSALMETSHEELRRIYTRSFETACTNQQQLFTAMQQYGLYQVAQATAEQINAVQHAIQNNLDPGSRA